MHLGLAQMLVNEKRNCMKGNYFTNNKTRGTIRFKKLSRKHFSLYVDAKRYLDKIRKKKGIYNKLYFLIK
jgi:hypothetical protein